MDVTPIDIDQVRCPRPECGSLRITIEFRVCLKTTRGGRPPWTIASDYQPLDDGIGICDVCEHTGPIDAFHNGDIEPEPTTGATP